jgi:hypothetical protein
MCFYNDESPEFHETSIVTARKDHKCGWCGKQIAKGTQYSYSAGKFDGAFYTDKICNLCYQDSMTIVRHEMDEGCDWSESWPGNRDDQVEWFQNEAEYCGNLQRATVTIDLKKAYAELSAYERKKRKPVNS